MVLVGECDISLTLGYGVLVGCYPTRAVIGLLFTKHSNLSISGFLMNFITSVFSDDPHPSDSDNARSNEEASRHSEHRSNSSSSGDGAWEFGGLWKTLSAKSESIIETYRRDLQEFGTGLKKEIEVAHGSLESVGHVIDQFGNTVVKGTAHITSYLGSDDTDRRNSGAEGKNFNSKRYSRFDAQVRAIQGDVSTYTEAPEDLDEYNKWKSGFSLEGKGEELEGFLRENEAMDSVYKRLVPSVVDRDTFWFSYYYRVYRFKKAEDVMARLVKKMTREEEDLSWDVEEEDDDGVGDGTKRLNVQELHKSDQERSKSNEEKRGDFLQSKGIDDKKGEFVEESKVVEKMGDGNKKSNNEENKRNDSVVDSDKNVIVEKKVGHGKDSYQKEEDIEWDEIEGLSRIDDDKATRTGSPTIVDLRKRLSAAQQQDEEEEDLSWDIEDDDNENAKP